MKKYQDRATKNRKSLISHTPTAKIDKYAVPIVGYLTDMPLDYYRGTMREIISHTRTNEISEHSFPIGGCLTNTPLNYNGGTLDKKLR